MNPRPALSLALATVVAGAATATPAGARPAAERPDLVERCYVEGLTVAEAKAGEESDVWCVEVTEDASMAALDSSVLVELYDAADGSGTPLLLQGTTCSGLTVNWGPTHPWNDRVSSTDLVVCGSAKHWQNSGFTGANQAKSGSGFHQITGTMNNATSSIQYG